MLDVARILTTTKENPYFEKDDAWLLLAAAGAQLRTVASDEPLIVTSSFLTRRWASRVRAMIQADQSQAPSWFRPLAVAADELPADKGALREFVVHVTRAAWDAKVQHERRGAPIARFGVWLDKTEPEKRIVLG
jgi:hypothetical protein